MLEKFKHEVEIFIKGISKRELRKNPQIMSQVAILKKYIGDLGESEYRQQIELPDFLDNNSFNYKPSYWTL